VYLAMVEGYADAWGVTVAREALHAKAQEWSITRGARSGRVAWQFVQDLAGRMGLRLDQPST
jgi:predicted AAA+ superfamily ATPase